MLVYFKEVYQALNLVLAFARRDLKLQYAQTYLGILWSVIQPLTALVIFGFFFRRVVPLRTNVPYTAFVFTGIIGWFYFIGLVAQVGTSLMNNQQLIKKIHFPLLVLPLSRVLVGLVEFCISLVILILLLFFTGGGISAKIVFLPLAVMANIITGLSIGIWLSALTIRFRDLHHIIPYLIGFGIWLTPVFYPTTMVPDDYNWVYYFHPIANIIALYRWIFIGLPFNVLQFASSFAITLLIFISGLFFFVRNEKYVAEHL